MTFADHLNEWCARHGYSSYRAAIIFEVSATAVRNWRRGEKCHMQKALRALMLIHDEGRDHRLQSTQGEIE